MLYQIIKERAAQVMRKKKLTQTKLAELTGISRVSIGKAVNGKPCRYSTIYEISQALDIYPGYLIGEWDKQDRFTTIANLDGTPIYFPELNLEAFTQKNNA